MFRGRDGEDGKIGASGPPGEIGPSGKPGIVGPPGRTVSHNLFNIDFISILFH